MKLSNGQHKFLSWVSITMSDFIADNLLVRVDEIITDNEYDSLDKMLLNSLRRRFRQQWNDIYGSDCIT